MKAKTTHGGTREGAGRKPALLPLHTKKFRASEEDWQRFLAYLKADAQKDFDLILLALDMFQETKARLQSRIREKHRNDR